MKKLDQEIESLQNTLNSKIDLRSKIVGLESYLGISFDELREILNEKTAAAIPAPKTVKMKTRARTTRRISDEDRALIAKAAQTHTVPEVARKFGVAKSSVFRFKKEFLGV